MNSDQLLAKAFWGDNPSFAFKLLALFKRANLKNVRRFVGCDKPPFDSPRKSVLIVYEPPDREAVNELGLD